MSSVPSDPTDPRNIFVGIIEGAILGTVIIPVVQKVIREIVTAAPDNGQSEPTVELIFISVRLLPLLPVLGTLAGGLTSYLAGRWWGLLGYAVGVLGASVLFNRPEYAMSLFVVGFIITTVAYLVRSKRSRRRHSRPPRF